MSNPKDIETAVNKFMEIITAEGGTIIDVKLASTDTTFDVLIFYRGL